jgi:hypothetical protein
MHILAMLSLISGFGNCSLRCPNACILAVVRQALPKYGVTTFNVLFSSVQGAEVFDMFIL